MARATTMILKAHRRNGFGALRQLDVHTEGFRDPMEYKESVSRWNQQAAIKTL